MGRTINEDYFHIYFGLYSFLSAKVQKIIDMCKQKMNNMS